MNLISIDCGGTNLRVAARDEKLHILSVKRCATINNNPSKLYELRRSFIKEVSEDAKYDKIDSIGRSLCGIVIHNKIGRVGNLGINGDFDFESKVREDFPGAKIKIANDGNCSALVESKFGANRGKRDSAFVTISTGIGLGIVHNGKRIDTTLEAGRVLTNYKGKLYELEGLLSGKGIGTLCKLNGIEDIPSGKEFFEAVRQSREDIRPVYEEWKNRMAVFFADLQLLFDNEAYALSGGVRKSKDLFVEDVEKKANALIEVWHLHPIVLNEALFKQDVGLAAGCALALDVLGK